MHKWSSKDRLHRTAKLLLDTGEAKTMAEAEKIISTYQLSIEVGADVADSPTLQALLLTAVNAGRRCFLGGVQVAGHFNTALKVHWNGLSTIKEAIQDLHGSIVEKVTPGIPRIIIGDVLTPSETGDFAVRATFNGWSGGVIPLEEKIRLPERSEFEPAGVLAGALAISEAFQFVRGNNVLAGRRNIGLSLWNPDSSASWLADENKGPAIKYLPANLWMIGLGHLGQAFLWTLGLLPYQNANEVNLVLQDYDKISEANDSTSPLTFPTLIEGMKTRLMANWCQKRGFSTRICERKFDSNFTITTEEPSVALCGVDNAQARAQLEQVGFRRIIEAGLGRGANEYLAFQMHTFPGPHDAKSKWKSTTDSETLADTNLPLAYRALADEGFDTCGLTMLAGRTVGASFVGLFSASLVIAELIRMAHDQHQYAVIDGSLRSLEHMKAIINDKNSGAFNPGITNKIS